MITSQTHPTMSHGRYSSTARRAFSRRTSNYTHTHGPPSERTRSQIRLRTAPNHNNNPTLQLTTPAAGTFSHAISTPQRVQENAAHRLRRSRIKLRRYLTSDRWRKDDIFQDLPEPSTAQIRQLGTLDGSIAALPRPVPRAARRVRSPRRLKCSGLRDVWCHLSERERDNGFAVLPGEV